jgi:hypothetical protein
MAELFPRVVGDAWHALPTLVRALHEGRPRRRAIGTFTVTSAASWLGRLVIRMFGMPRPGTDVAMALDVEVSDTGETWARRIGGTTMVTQQYETAGVVAERQGPLEIRFALHVVDGRLRYDVASAWLCLGQRRLRLPRWLAPCGSAVEWVEGGTLHTKIEIAVPILGSIVEYGGPLALQPTASSDASSSPP